MTTKTASPKPPPSPPPSGLDTLLGTPDKARQAEIVRDLMAGIAAPPPVITITVSRNGVCHPLISPHLTLDDAAAILSQAAADLLRSAAQERAQAAARRDAPPAPQGDTHVRKNT